MNLCLCIGGSSKIDFVCVLAFVLRHAGLGGRGGLKLELDWTSRLTWTSLLVFSSTPLSKYFMILFNVSNHDNSNLFLKLWKGSLKNEVTSLRSSIAIRVSSGAIEEVMSSLGPAPPRSRRPRHSHAHSPWLAQVVTPLLLVETRLMAPPRLAHQGHVAAVSTLLT
jgi:hypothetical protein